MTGKPTRIVLQIDLPNHGRSYESNIINAQLHNFKLRPIFIATCGSMALTTFIPHLLHIYNSDTCRSSHHVFLFALWFFL